MAPALLRRCNVITKGRVFADNDREKETLTRDNLWWLINATNKQYIAAYFSEKQNSLRELSLNQCIDVWGSDPPGITEDESADGNLEMVQTCDGPRSYIPIVPPKYADFVRRRKRIFREIRNMRKIVHHRNVIHLFGVLELTQESKCTIFLVMELANGGELFDRIKIDCGTREETAKYFFQQLLYGVKHCHNQGVCHRDLKPEVIYNMFYYLCQCLPKRSVIVRPSLSGPYIALKCQIFAQFNLTSFRTYYCKIHLVNQELF